MDRILLFSITVPRIVWSIRGERSWDTIPGVISGFEIRGHSTTIITPHMLVCCLGYGKWYIAASLVTKLLEHIRLQFMNDADDFRGEDGRRRWLSRLVERWIHTRDTQQRQIECG